MSYQSLYRKYRSQSFDDLIGQDHVVRTLQSAISRGRIAHAYLFTGPRGTGKTSTARLLAKALCCENGPTPTPDGTCEICRDITIGACVDVIEMDAASESGVDAIREGIIETVEYRPVVARYKVFIIDEVHDLSRQAFDALLKTIEEPPEHIIFILATTEFHKVPTTIRSRCQKYDFHRATMSDLVGRLQYVAQGEGVQIEPEAISAIARMADGGYRDALTLLEQAILTAEDGKVTLGQVYDQLGLVNEETVDGVLLAIKEGDVPGIMGRLAEVARLGRDPRALLESMMHRLADLTRASYGVALGAEDASREASLHETAVRLGRDTIVRVRTAVAHLHDAIRDISLPRVWLESEMIRLAGPVSTGPVVAEPVRTPTQEPIVKRVIGEPRPTAPTAPVVTAPVAPPIATPEASPAQATPLETAPMEAAPMMPAPDAVALTGDTALDRAIAAWSQTRETLGAKSGLMAAKLQDSVVIGRADNTVTVQFERQIDQLDWILEGSKRAPAILACFRELIGEPSIEIRYVVRRKEVVENNEAVELPVEGSRLEQLLKDTFGDANAAGGEPGVS
ncbi:DNA polymerase III subunit gamma/tau [bacterium]|nr:MAG: DNA polymerase III subunit gamma/tau [bacterium]